MIGACPASEGAYKPKMPAFDRQLQLAEAPNLFLLQEAAGSGNGGDSAIRLAAAVVAAEEQLHRAKGQVARLHAQSQRLWDSLPPEVCSFYSHCKLYDAIFAQAHLHKENPLVAGNGVVFCGDS